MNEKKLREWIKSFSPKHLHKEIDAMPYGKLLAGTERLMGALSLDPLGKKVVASSRKYN